jgi:tol-pal system protein YbgF
MRQFLRFSAEGSYDPFRGAMRSCNHIVGLASIVLMGGCAHRQANPAEVEQLNRALESMRAQNAVYAKQIEELENRIFILSDQIDSRKVNDEKVAAPKLPTVTLHPTAVEPTTAMASAPPGTETASEPEVEYAGEAAKPTVHRPILRLHGDSAEVSITREAPSPSPPTRVVHEGMPAKIDRPEAVVLYRKSYEALRAGKHDEAMQGFRDFLRAFPAHDLADNSQYWLGECYYDRKDYASAVREFRRVIERYPNGNKVPDALLKVGYSYLALGSTEAGRQTLGQLQRSYPRHEAAALAESRLAELDRSNGVRGAGESSSTAAPAAKTAHALEEAP